VTRIDPDILTDLIEIRSQTTKDLKKVEEALKRDDYEEILTWTAHSMAVIIRKKMWRHEALRQIHDRLRTIFKRTYTVIDGTTMKPGLHKQVKTLLEELDVTAYSYHPAEIQRPPGFEYIGDRVPSVPPVPHGELSLSFENDVPIVNTAESVTVTLTFKAPRTTGLTVDAHATIIVDRSLAALRFSAGISN